MRSSVVYVASKQECAIPIACLAELGANPHGDQDMNYQGSTCICRVPKAQLRQGTIVECVHCGESRGFYPVSSRPLTALVQVAEVAVPTLDASSLVHLYSYPSMVLQRLVLRLLYNSFIPGMYFSLNGRLCGCPHSTLSLEECEKHSRCVGANLSG